MELTGRIRRLASDGGAALALVLAAAGPAFAAPLPVADAAARTTPAERAARALSDLFAADAQRGVDLDPLGALERGETIAPDRLTQLFTDRLEQRQRQANRDALAELERIDRTALSREQRISYDVFRADLLAERVALRPENRALTAVRPLNHFNGLHVDYPSLVSGQGALPFASVADYDAALALNRAFPRVLDQAIARFREGMKSGVVESRLTVRNMIGQIDALLAHGVEESPFYGPIVAMPENVPPADRARLEARYRAAIADDLMPAYRRLRAFLANEYLPAAREDVGLSAMKGGSRLYRQLVERHTTLPLEPDAVHRLGLSEVARIRGEMEAVKARVGFTGDLRAFFDYIREDPRFHPKTREEFAEGFEAIGRAVETQIPRFFSRVPRTPLRIVPYPAYRERYEAGASYAQGSPDGTRPGTFYFNAYDLPQRFTTGMTTLYLHEGAPGHHFQISLAQENESLPDFQRFGGNTAYQEGWALYAETLGFEMGLYQDPWQHWGTLDDEMLRAMRLVVDTGLHTQGWSRDKAVAYMLDNSGMGRTDAAAEVERYIANPGQALAYKIGALTIQRLRREAEAALGERFDIRAFHDEVLGSGALPLPVLEGKIRQWITAQA